MTIGADDDDDDDGEKKKSNTMQKPFFLRESKRICVTMLSTFDQLINM